MGDRFGALDLVLAPQWPIELLPEHIDDGVRVDLGRSHKNAGPRSGLGRLVLAVGASGVAIWAHNLTKQGNIADGVLLFLVAVVLLLLALRGSGDRLAAPTTQEATLPAKAAACRSGTASTILVPAGIVANVIALALFRFHGPQAVAWAFFLSSLALVIAGLRRRATGQAASAGANRVLPHIEILLLALIVLVGAFMRLHNLAEQPAGLFYDEAVYGLDAQRVARGEDYPVYFESNYGRGALFIYLLAGFVEFLGSSAFSLRLASAFIGIATIPALYVFVRPLFGARPALVAAALLAVSRWHINFSRIAFDAITLPLLEVVVLHFLIKALRRGDHRDFVWAGVGIGLGLNGYVAFRLVPVIAAFYVVVALARERGDLRRALAGLVVLLLTIMVVASPLIQLYLLHPDVLSQRLSAASVFADKDFASGVWAILDNTGKHLMMFNVRGDPNGRHNLPGEPMLDPVTGGLFVMGVVYGVWHSSRKEYALLLFAFLVMLSAGILSVDFEAPQALRSLGAVVPTVVFAALALAYLGHLAQKQGLLSTRAGAAGIVLVLAVISYLTYGNYFVRQARDFASWNDFSTGPTLTAREMQRLGPNWQHYVSAIWFEEPTLTFLTPDVTGYQRIGPTDFLPLPDGGDRGVALFLDPQQSGLFEEAKRFYPKASFRQFRPPFPGPATMLEVLLSKEDLRHARGLDATYFASNAWSGQPMVEQRDASIDFDWARQGIAPPFAVEWTGVLRVGDYAPRILGVRSPDRVEVWVDEKLVLPAAGERRVLLARGNHQLRVRAVVPDPQGHTVLYWLGPGGPSPVSAAELYSPPVSSEGLLGSYFPNLKWSGEPALRQIDPNLEFYFHMTPLPRPYTVDWRGKIYAPETGHYVFGLESIDDSWLQIDGGAILEARVGNQLQENSVFLEAGWHDIVVRYMDRSGWSHINLYWTPPAGTRQIVPAERLRPPTGADAGPAWNIGSSSSSEVPATALNATIAAQSLRVLRAPSTDPLELKSPKDVFIGNDGALLVADSENSRVLRFSADGRFLGQIGKRGDKPGELQNPLGIAMMPDGDILVLDEATGFVNRFDAEGRFKQRFAGAGSFFHARALAAGPDGTIYVADTGNARVVIFNNEGLKRGEIGGRGSDRVRLLGPTSIAVDREHTLWVLDSEHGRVQRLTRAGQYLGGFQIPPGESVDGAHLALGPRRIFVTDPLENVVRAYSYDGESLGAFGGRGEANGQLMRPVGIAVDQAGNVWVAERDNDRVQQFGVGP